MSGQARDSNVGSAAQAVRYSHMCQLCLSKRSASTIKQGTKKTVRRTVRSFQPAFSAHKQINFQEDRHRISDIAVGPGPSFSSSLYADEEVSVRGFLEEESGASSPSFTFSLQDDEDGSAPNFSASRLGGGGGSVDDDVDEPSFGATLEEEEEESEAPVFTASLQGAAWGSEDDAPTLFTPSFTSALQGSSRTAPAALAKADSDGRARVAEVTTLGL